MTKKLVTAAASEAELRQLHGVIARTYLRSISDYERGRVKDRNNNTKSCPASLLAAAARFLSDNGVDRPERAKNLRDPLNLELPNYDGKSPKDKDANDE